MPAGEHDERVDRLDHPGAGRPAAADARPRARRRPPRRAASAASPRSTAAAGRRPRAWIRSASSTSRMSVSTGRRLRARPIRPRWRSSRSCSCWTGSKPFSRRIALGLPRPSRGRRVGGGPGHGEEVVDHRPEDAEQLAGVAAVVGEVVDVGLAQRVERRASPRRSSGGPGACSSAAASSRRRRSSSVGERAARVDPEVVDDRLHGERQGVVERAP